MRSTSRCTSSRNIASRNIAESRRKADPLAASIWAVNAAIESGRHDAIDGIVREASRLR